MIESASSRQPATANARAPTPPPNADELRKLSGQLEQREHDATFGWEVLPIAAPTVAMVGSLGLAASKRTYNAAGPTFLAGAAGAGGAFMGVLAGVATAGMSSNRGGIHAEADASRASVTAAAVSVGIVGAITGTSAIVMAVGGHLTPRATMWHALLGGSAAAAMAGTAANAAYVTQLHDAAVDLRFAADGMVRR
jgi:hypothetical protein